MAIDFAQVGLFALAAAGAATLLLFLIRGFAVELGKTVLVCIRVYKRIRSKFP